MFNMGLIHWQNDAQDEAMQTWGKVYAVAAAIQSAPALEALADLAEQLDLPDGVAGWARFAPDAGEA